MGKNPVQRCRPRQLSDVVENSRLVQSHISVPDGARPFGEVTPHSKTTGTPSVLPTFGHQMWGTRGRSRRASFASDQMGIQKEQHLRVVYCVQRKWRRYIVMLEHFPASDPQNGSSAWGELGTGSPRPYSRRCSTPRGFEDLEPLKGTVEDAQVAAALTLKSEHTAFPSLSL